MLGNQLLNTIIKHDHIVTVAFSKPFMTVMEFNQDLLILFAGFFKQPAPTTMLTNNESQKPDQDSCPVIHLLFAGWPTDNHKQHLEAENLLNIHLKVWPVVVVDY